MTLIETVAEDAADDAVAVLYAGARESMGFVPNSLSAFSLRPIMAFAEKVAGDASSITEADIQRLRNVGLSDRDIFDVVAAAAARCFFSKTLDALGAEPDAAFADLEPGLREALTVGRPIEQG